MFNTSSVQLDWQGLNLQLETGMIARQADGAVLATLGSTSVLCTVTAAKEADPNIDFFPLSVHYIEKGYALHLGINDEEYKNVGVEIKNSSEVLSSSNLITKVNCPSEDEIVILRENTINCHHKIVILLH